MGVNSLALALNEKALASGAAQRHKHRCIRAWNKAMIFSNGWKLCSTSPRKTFTCYDSRRELRTNERIKFGLIVIKSQAGRWGTRQEFNCLRVEQDSTCTLRGIV